MVATSRNKVEQASEFASMKPVDRTSAQRRRVAGTRLYPAGSPFPHPLITTNASELTLLIFPPSEPFLFSDPACLFPFPSFPVLFSPALFDPDVEVAVLVGFSCLA
jgi:hypothetical protein